MYANIYDPALVTSSLDILECANNTNKMECMMKINQTHFITEYEWTDRYIKPRLRQILL